MTNRPKLPIGMSDFRQIIEGGYCYVDKSLFVKEIIDASPQVMLFPRPRRFGKTLNLSMVRYFFEKADPPNDGLFHSLAIWEADERYRAECGQHPVVYLTLKDVKSATWEECLGHLKSLISDEYRRHRYLVAGDALDEDEAAEFATVTAGTASGTSLENTLSKLLRYLERHHTRKPLLLIDEYDAPIHAGFTNGYYDEVISFMRNWLSGGLKDNPSLARGILTGILRVAKESIFSGLNNLWVYGLLNEGPFSDKFGFTEEEVAGLLRDYGRANKRREVEDWYNGYDFGGVTVHNPWSILGFLNTPSGECLPHWLNTSSNDLVYSLMERGGDSLRQDLESLLAGDTLTRPVDDNIVLRDVERSKDAIWSFLLHSGYLKAGNPQRDPVTDEVMYELRIPNREVRTLYQGFVRDWLGTTFEQEKLRELHRALIAGESSTFGELLQEFVLTMLSYHDVGQGQSRLPEAVYQAFVLGLLANVGHSYTIRSNREAGLGRADIVMIPKAAHLPGIVMEFKSIDETQDVESQLVGALEQIREKHYTLGVADLGVERVHALAIVFDGTRIHVREWDGKTSL